MPSSAQFNAQSMLIETQIECQHSNADTGEAMQLDASAISRYKRHPSKIPARAAEKIAGYWSKYCLSKLKVPTWIKNDLEELRVASVQPAVNCRARIERRMDGFRVALRRVPLSEVKELVGAKYLVGLSLFILYTSRNQFQRRDAKHEMVEALQLLESALKIGIAEHVVSAYMAARISMQIQGGHYNLHEHEFLKDVGLLQEMRLRLRATKAVANVWTLHKMCKKDPTPLHNGIVFCCTLGTPRYIKFARKFLRALIKLDKRFASSTFKPDGLSALGTDPLVDHHRKELYPNEKEDNDENQD